MHAELGGITGLRDLQIEQALDYPAVSVNVNRELAGQLGVTMDQVGRRFAAATSSSRFVAPNYWADPRTGIAFQVQVEIPQPQMTTLDDLRSVPVTANRAMHPLLGDVAHVENSTVVGEYDRFNGQRMITLSANLSGEDPGRAADGSIGRSRRQERRRAARLSRSAGSWGAMRETFRNIAAGMGVAIVVIFLLLAANFQSLRLALVVLSTVPAVLAGVVLMLAATRTTLNVAVVHGCDHGDRRRGGERHSAGDVRGADAAPRRSRPLTPRSTPRDPGCDRC